MHWNWLQNSDHLESKITLLHQKLDEQPLKEIDLSFSYCKDPTFISKQIFKRPIRAETVKINLDNCTVGSEGINGIIELIDKAYVKRLDLNLDSI